MNINELWSVLTGPSGHLNKVLRALAALKKDHEDIELQLDDIQASLIRLEVGNTPWQTGVKDQLERIEEAVVGTEAARLIVSIGAVEEQP